MDTCRLTQEQVAALAAGRTVRTKYRSPGEYGYMDSLEIEIIPPADGTVDDPLGGARRRTDGNLREAFGRDDQGEKSC